MHYGPVLFFVVLVSTLGAAQQKKPRAMTGSAAAGGAPANLKVAPDLEQRVAKFRRVPMPFRTAGLSAREQQLVRKLVEACGYLESVYWRQSDPEGLTLYQSLASSRNRRDVELRRYCGLTLRASICLTAISRLSGPRPCRRDKGSILRT